MTTAYLLACTFNGAAAFLLGMAIMAGMFDAKPIVGVGVILFGLFGFSYSLYKAVSRKSEIGGKRE